MRRAEPLEGGELDHAAHLSLEDHGQDDHAERARLDQTRADPPVFGGHLLEEDLPLLVRALPHEPGPDPEALRSARFLVERVAREQREPLPLLRLIHEIERRALRVHHRRQLREDHLAHCEEVLLSLEHAAELGQVRLQPVLLAVLRRGLAQVPDHLVGGVLEHGDLTARLHLDLLGQIPLGHGGRHVGDRAHLRREVGRELVHVVGEVLPGSRRAGHARLSAQLPFHAHLARHRGHLIREGGERVDHRVDRVRQLRDLPLGLQGELPPEIAVRDPRHDPRDSPHLPGEVGGHGVHVVGEILPHA